MRAIAFGRDEFGLVDDPVDFLVLASEGQECGQRGALGIEGIHVALGEALRRGHAYAIAEVAYQIAEDRLLASEVRVEAAQRDARALGNRGDRRLMKSTFPELGRRCVEELAPWSMEFDPGLPTE